MKLNLPEKLIEELETAYVEAKMEWLDIALYIARQEYGIEQTDNLTKDLMRWFDEQGKYLFVMPNQEETTE